MVADLGSENEGLGCFMTEGWRGDKQNCWLFSEMERSGRLPCFPRSPWLLVPSWKCSWTFRFQQKVNDDRIVLWGAGHQAQIIIGLKCLGCWLLWRINVTISSLGRDIFFCVCGSQVFWECCFQLFPVGLLCPRRAKCVMCRLSCVLLPLWRLLLDLGGKLSSTLHFFKLHIPNPLGKGKKQNDFHSLSIGPCSPSKQLGELLHGDPDGNRSSCLHHELYHWEEQKQPSGSCVVQYPQGAARKQLCSCW